MGKTEVRKNEIRLQV